MPRARYIKPGFLKNEDLAECEPLARLLYTGLWMWADREGRMEDRPKRIKANILPYDDCDGETLLAQLAEKGFVNRYEVEGQRYLEVVNFKKHQHPHQNEPNSTIPCAKNSSACTVQDQECSSANPARLLDNWSTGLLEECIEKVVQIAPHSATTVAAPSEARALVDEVRRRPSTLWVDDRHAKWYGEYWNHKSKPQSRKAYERALHSLVGAYRSTDSDSPSRDLYDRAARFLLGKVTEDRTRFEGTAEWESRVRMLPATWLNNRRWEDESTPEVSKLTVHQERNRQTVSAMNMLEQMRNSG